MTEFPRVGGHSIWRAIQTVHQFGPYACAVSTAGHGGFWVSPEGMGRVPENARSTGYSRGGWFEEDCDWCIPYLVLGLHAYESEPHRVEAMQAEAKRYLHRCHPDLVVMVLEAIAA